jgi:hypothetical protein
MVNASHVNLLKTLELLREVAHHAYHVLEASEESEIRAAAGADNVDALDAALQAFIDHCDPEGRGGTDAHPACHFVDQVIADLDQAYVHVAMNLAGERHRQIAEEGFDAAHDDAHSEGQLARAAASYALVSIVEEGAVDIGYVSSHLQKVLEWLWPWSVDWWKPKDRRCDLVRAGALIVAEIERLDRAAAAGEVTEPKTTLTDGSPVTPDHRETDPATGLQKGYVVLSAAERAKGFVRPLRDSYLHLTCGKPTHMHQALAETYARQPDFFYSGTYCAHCRDHFPGGAEGEFVWYGTEEKVGT